MQFIWENDHETVQTVIIGSHFLATCLVADSRLSVSSSEDRRLIIGRMSFTVFLAVSTCRYSNNARFAGRGPRVHKQQAVPLEGWHLGESRNGTF